MLLTRLLNACHHFPGFVYEGARLCEATQSIEIDVRARKGSKPICSCCGLLGRGYDSLTQRRFEFIPVWGFAVFLLYTMRRVDCRTCGVKVEALPWANGKHTLTRAYVIFLAQCARKLSWKETAQSFRTSWEKVFNAVEWVVDWRLNHRELGTPRALGVDEIQYGRGHDYLTLVYQIEAGCTRLLWVGQQRTKESFSKFFAMLGQQLCETVEFVCSDMWKPYLEMIALHCPNALNILDRFHIVAKMNKAIDEVRAEESRRMARDGYEPVLKKSRWCLLKRRENLTGKQRVRLRELVQYNLRSVRAWLLKEQFQQLWEDSSPTWAGKFIDQWCTDVMRSRIEPMKKFARTVRSHRDLILNYFHARKQFSSGIVEGLNNKAKVTMRKAYGFRTFRAKEIALYHALGKLPEPPITHSFY
ncbi:ISL3 family transposase [Paraburkholderia xenovorans]|uniref:ISL3 family transposase n=1 Tax=Paraburkholderia xenovorans TaxID=36873 RepID=UPI0038BC7621